MDAAEARIEVYILSNNGKDELSKDEIKKKLEEYFDFSITAEDHKLNAIARVKETGVRDWRQALTISFRVFVPREVSTDLETSGGGIHLDNIQGTEEFTTSGGGLHLNKVGGKITGRTSGGGIDVTNSKDDIDLETSGGNIHAENCSGNITLNTSGGSVSLNELQGTIRANTSGGSVHGDDIKGELEATTSGGGVTLRNLACSVETSTSGGSMNVEIKELVKYVRVTNSSGNITVKMPGDKGVNLKVRADKIQIDALTNFSGTKESDEINGKLNGGGIPVTISAGSGRVTMELRK